MRVSGRRGWQRHALRDCQEGYLGNGTLCEDIDECKLSRWIRWVLWKIRFHHKLKPPRTTTAPENDTTTPRGREDTDPISSTPSRQTSQDKTTPSPTRAWMTRSALARPGTGPIVELMDWSTESWSSGSPTLSSTCLPKYRSTWGRL